MPIDHVAAISTALMDTDEALETLPSGTVSEHQVRSHARILMQSVADLRAHERPEEFQRIIKEIFGADTRTVLEVLRHGDISAAKGLKALADLPHDNDTVDGWNLRLAALLAEPKTRTDITRESAKPVRSRTDGEYSALFDWLATDTSLSRDVRLEALARFDLYVASGHAFHDLLGSEAKTDAAIELARVFQRMRAGEEVDVSTIKTALDRRWGEIMSPIALEREWLDEGDMLVARRTTSAFSLINNTPEGSGRADIAITTQADANAYLIGCVTSDENIDNQGDQISKYVRGVAQAAALCRRENRTINGFNASSRVAAVSLYNVAVVFPNRRAHLDLSSSSPLTDADVRNINILSLWATLADTHISQMAGAADPILAAKHAAVGMGGSTAFTTYGYSFETPVTKLVERAAYDVVGAVAALARIDWSGAYQRIDQKSTDLLLSLVHRSIKGLITHYSVDAQPILVQAIEDLNTIKDGLFKAKRGPFGDIFSSVLLINNPMPAPAAASPPSEAFMQAYKTRAVGKERLTDEVDRLLEWMKRDVAATTQRKDVFFLKKMTSHPNISVGKKHLWSAVFIGAISPKTATRSDRGTSLLDRDPRNQGPEGLHATLQNAQAFHLAVDHLPMAERDNAKRRLLGRLKDLKTLVATGVINYPVGDEDLRLAATVANEEWEELRSTPSAYREARQRAAGPAASQLRR